MVYPCPGHCGKVFTRKVNLHEHLEVSSYKGDKKVCRVCNSKFNDPSTLYAHASAKHRTMTGVQCHNKYCKYIFLKKSEYPRHKIECARIAAEEGCCKFLVDKKSVSVKEEEASDEEHDEDFEAAEGESSKSLADKETNSAKDDGSDDEEHDEDFEAAEGESSKSLADKETSSAKDDGSDDEEQNKDFEGEYDGFPM